MQSASPTDKTSVLIIAAVSSFLTPFMGSAVNIALPTIAQEFRMDAVLLSWIPTAFILSAVAFLIPFGRLADIHGRKRLFLFGIDIFTVSCLLMSVASSPAELILYRAVQGSGSAMIFGTAIAILTSVFPAAERGKAIGITVGAVYLGLTLGPVLGGLLTRHLGWRSIFLCTVPVCMAVITLVMTRLRGDWAEARGESFDYAGAALYSVSLLLVALGFSSLPRLTGPALLAAGLGGLVAFGLWERRVRHPLFDVTLLLGNRLFVLSNLSALINYSATFATGFLLSLYLQFAKGLTPDAAGLLLVVQPLIMTVLAPLAGRLSDRVEPRVLASAGMGLTVLGLAVFSFIGETTSLVAVVAGLMLLGLGFALFSSPNANAVMGSIDKKFYGVASGTIATMRLLGQMVSMAAVTTVFTLTIGRVQITRESYQTFLESERLLFIGFAVLCACGIYTSLARGRVR